MRVLVTGGAGFIGSAVCRHFVSDLKYDVVVVDKLTYAGNLASLAPIASSPHFAFEKHDICEARRSTRSLRSTNRRGRPSCCRKPRRSIDLRIGRVREDECAWHIHAARGGPQISPSRHEGRIFASFMCRPTRSMVRLAPTAVYRDDTYDPSSPYSATKAASDHLAKGVAPDLWTAGDRVELLEQLWPLSLSGKTDPANHSECARAQAAACLWRWIECARLALCRRPRACARRHSGQGRVRRDLQHWWPK